jgi:hypothetical protein
MNKKTGVAAGAGSQPGADNVGTPGTPPPPSGSTGAGSPKRGAFPTPRNVLADATPYQAGSQPGAGNVGIPGIPPPPG